MNDSVTYERTGGVGTLRLTRPKAGNAMDRAFWRGLNEVGQEIARDSDVAVLLIRADGDHFSFGLDLKDFAEVLGAPDLDDAAFFDVVTLMQQGLRQLATLPIPVIAAIQGYCIGAGVHLAATADIRLGSASAQFSIREVALALQPDLGGLPYLRTVVPRGTLTYWAMTAKYFDAEEAIRGNLLNEIVPSDDLLSARASVLAAEFASRPKATLIALKEILSNLDTDTLEHSLARSASHSLASLRRGDVGRELEKFLRHREGDH